MAEQLQQIMIMLQQLQQDNKTIHQENSQLRLQMEQLQATQASTQASTSAPATITTQAEPSMSIKAPKISLPDKFDGNRRKFRGFVNQVKLVFQMQPNTYLTDKIKIGFIGSLLSGPALDWFAPLMERSSPLLSDMKEFSAQFEATFGDTDKARTAAIKIRSLRQGNRPAASYASEFQQLACDLNWDDAALMDQFRSGLRGDVKDLLISFQDPADLNAAITMAIRCDNRLFERRQERQLEVTPMVGSTGTTMSPLPRLSPSQANDPMQVDAVQFKPLTNDEKERRCRNNLCLYCGGSGHMVRNCPLKLRIASVGTTPNSENGQAQLQ